ncbi:MAG: DUF4160 domain-containing protein [Chloroflexota bacterium]|nr:DUF4160 domain-containing protein [Chloroflexota bacterium]MDE2969732.1 DUF4160 domain-containing protein [Chloroflexota bacterium]
MPLLLRSGPYRIFIVSFDLDEPPHVHVQRENAVAKLWLDPVRVQRDGGFSGVEIRRILRIVEANEADLLEKWNDHRQRG